MCESPLCVFCLSPSFTIRSFVRSPEKSTSRRLSVRCWRRRDSSQSSIRPRFKPFKRRSSHFLSKHIQETLNSYNGKTLTIEEVLTEIQKAWRPLHPSNSYTNMSDNSGKSSTEMVSPILQRRRLSAPETIMRKHALAQQRCDSQDSSDSSRSSEKSSSRMYFLGSDNALNKKRDSDSMRKSTLLRRFFSKPLSNSRFSGSFTEWQRSYGRFSSVHSSPEHLVKSQSRRSLNDDYKYSPQHHKSLSKLSPKHLTSDENSNPSTRRRNLESYSNSFSENISTSVTNRDASDASRLTNTNTSYTAFSDNSDSAYTNSRSNFSAFSNNNSSTAASIQKEIVEETDASNQEINNSLEFSKSVLSKYSKECESSTQTPKTTNVNVISNVQLSQSTLDLIFSHVMQDVNNSKASHQVDNNENKIVQVQNIPSFYLKCKEEGAKERSDKMISNVGIGSPYSKPPLQRQPQNVVPRFSALPSSTSMEVNISSGDSDKESDTVSLVDSLEDQSSPRTNPEGKASAKISDVSLELPDNSGKKTTSSKPTAFFIPIELDQPVDTKTVSELLPSKVKNRLLKRQQKREEKQAKTKFNNSFGNKSDSNYLSASEKCECASDVNLNTSTPLSECQKLHLPSIETLRKIKIDKNKFENKTEHKINKGFKRKTLYKTSAGESFSSRSKTHWIPKVKNKPEKLSPICTAKNEYVYDCGPRRIYHKTEFNNTSKKIEILEIMECVETSPKPANFLKKSKIPVLINPKLPKLQTKSAQKPTFLDMDGEINDDKLDQLIANILIETLNIPEMQKSFNKSDESESKSSEMCSSKFQQQFEVIPEELSMQSSVQLDDASNNNNSNNNNINNEQISSISNKSSDSASASENKSSYQGKAAVAVVKDENFSSIPKGWITFYMLHKNRGSPDSTSDEGKELDDKTVNAISEKLKENLNKKIEVEKHKETDLISSYMNSAYNNVLKKEKPSHNATETFSSSSENHQNPRKSILFPTNSTGRFRKQSHQRKIRQKQNINEIEKYKQFGEWSVTVSGTTNCGQSAPNLEMCLKFPDLKNKCNCPSQSDSGLGEDNEKTLFPHIQLKNQQFKNEQNKSDSSRQCLPVIDQNKIPRKQRRSESSVPSLGSLMSSRIEPRQTRTSTKRYNLTRPKVDYSNNNLDVSNSTISLFNERHYAEILKRFPEILSITGNAINQDQK